MPRILFGLLFDIVAGLAVTGVVAALAARALPTRPSGQAWLWPLALVSIVTAGTARRRLVARGRGPLGWARRIRLRRGRAR